MRVFCKLLPKSEFPLTYTFVKNELYKETNYIYLI